MQDKYSKNYKVIYQKFRYIKSYMRALIFWYNTRYQHVNILLTVYIAWYTIDNNDDDNVENA